MVARHSITTFFDSLLNIHALPDASLNGLQVEGAEEVTKVAFAVDASLETFQKTLDSGAQLLVVHHGLFWGDRQHPITALMKKRLQFLLTHDLSLYAVHHPLDQHMQYGNNANLFQWLGLKEPKPFGFNAGFAVGVMGNFEQPLSFSAFVELVSKKIAVPLQAWQFGKKEISSVAICSGSGGVFLDEAILRNVDVFLTGEVHHQHKVLAQEGNISVVAAGHYATEVGGVKSLQSLLEEKYKLSSIFIDAPTEL